MLQREILGLKVPRRVAKCASSFTMQYEILPSHSHNSSNLNDAIYSNIWMKKEITSIPLNRTNLQLYSIESQRVKNTIYCKTSVNRS